MSTSFGSEEQFSNRHLGPDASATQRMLAALGLESLDELVRSAVPAEILLHEELDLPRPLGESEVLGELEYLAGLNQRFVSLLGQGYSDCFTPAVIRRNILESPAWYTAYTPYQPEISQGRLEALLNFQTMVCDLTGMDVSNSSLLDEPTAAAEAMTLCSRRASNKSDSFFVDEGCHVSTVEVIRTRAEPLGIELVVGDPLTDDRVASCFGVLLANPTTLGLLRTGDQIGAVAERVHGGGGLLVVTVDLLAQVLVAAPGDFGADVVVGSAQRFGVPLGFGGPHAAFMATTDAHVRSLPGRLVGLSKDSAGRPALRLSLQTREQHIRRDKATSNICTAQVLLAVIASMYACWHGSAGLTRIARHANRYARAFADGLMAAGIAVQNQEFFDTVVAQVPGRAADVVESARAKSLNLRLVDADRVAASFDETSTVAVLRAALASFGAHGDAEALLADANIDISNSRARNRPALDQPVFDRYHSEHEMLRYLRRLSDKDLALDRSMIPLGSCTMKLNAAAEMEAITWPSFAGIHPFAPIEQAKGSLELIRQLESYLCSVTGYDAVSLQPNAGSQGELAGLLAIRAFHLANGGTERDICLIPSSAHGTNAASAVMAGMRVVVVATDDNGNVDMVDLRAKIEASGRHLAAIMVTYPSTHGVYEGSIRELCGAVHDAGGQVYVDGANLNALVGLAKPGEFGADVSHLNLHKTFCIPHGGGGPGVGPVAVKSHLAPYLPNHPLCREAGPATGVGPISGAPFGSAGVLPISWAYIRLMGAEGLSAATKTAVLAANYVAARLDGAYPVLYVGETGRVAHECILDLRPMTKESGITAEDVAKRLIDYGFHAPTLSFPVAGTLMVEPTESESIHELDRFCEAMLAIRAEVDEVVSGRFSADDNPLVNAPHVAQDLVAEPWPHPYSREVAVFPSGVRRDTKYWPPVSRIDQAAGDRNLVCSCPSIEELASPVGVGRSMPQGNLVG